MLNFTRSRTVEDWDQVWFLQHQPILTLGRKADKNHILNSQKIPIIQTDRGGEVTYHSPGQLVVYFLLDLNKKNLDIGKLISKLELLIIKTLQKYKIYSYARKDAHGVYINLDEVFLNSKLDKETGAYIKKIAAREAKIASLGLRLHKSYVYHGLAFNINMDMSGFDCINPCGFKNMKMAQMQNFGNFDFNQIQDVMINLLTEVFPNRWQKIEKTQLLL